MIRCYKQLQRLKKQKYISLSEIDMIIDNEIIEILDKDKYQYFVIDDKIKNHNSIIGDKGTVMFVNDYFYLVFVLEVRNDYCWHTVNMKVLYKTI